MMEARGCPPPPHHHCPEKPVLALGDHDQMCFTSPALPNCTLSRPRSLVSVPLQLAQLARDRPNRPHTGAAASCTGSHLCKTFVVI